MTQLAQSFGLDLAYTLTSDAEFLADLFQSAGASVLKTKTQFKNSRYWGIATFLVQQCTPPPNRFR